MVSALVAGAAASVPTTAAAREPTTLKLATWNLEWLISPEVFRQLEEDCAPADARVSGRERRLPCDVAFRIERSYRDLRALARYARQLDADIVALQEVDGPEAARHVFPDHAFCFTKRPHLQNNGFAIRPGLPHRCGPDVDALSLGDSVRRGAQLVVFPGEAGELRLLSVHLKAGCSRDLLNSNDRACRELARQVPALEAWIDRQARARKRFAILGDFNRDLVRETGAARSKDGRLLRLWPEIDDADPPEADLVNAAQNQTFRNCTPLQPFTAYIDFIVLSRTLAQAVVPGSFERLTYAPADAHRARLSDHCPVAVRVGSSPTGY